MDARLRAALMMALPMVLAGCEHAVWGNMTALGMTVCLFVGTLQLGRRPAAVAEKKPAKPSGAAH